MHGADVQRAGQVRSEQVLTSALTPTRNATLTLTLTLALSTGLLTSALLRQLGAREDESDSAAAASVAMFTLAQRKLRFNFRVVGISERPADTFRLLKAAFPWLAYAACPLRSGGPSSKDQDRPPSPLLEALQKWNALDLQIYASAHASFTRALSKLDASAKEAKAVDDESSMFLHVHDASSEGKKNSKGKKKKQKKKKATEEADGEKADSDGAKADSDGDSVGGDGEKADSERVPTDKTESSGKKVDGDEAEADAKKADEGSLVVDLDKVGHPIDASAR